MYPGMMYWWKLHHGGPGWGAWAGCAPGWAGHARERADRSKTERWEEWAAAFAGRDDADDLGASAFGVRRPLRFLAFKLRLSDSQVAELARILAELKTERAQAEVDRRRTVAAFADAISGGTFDADKAAEGAALRVASAEHLRDAVLKALARIHEVLDPEQRERLAYLIRTGALKI